MSASITRPVVVGAAVTPSESGTSDPTAEVSGEDISALRGAVLILARRLRHQQAGDELSPSESAVMGRVGRAGPMTPGQLARSEHVQPPSITRIIERLEARGFLRRDPHPADRRQVLVSRTAEGDHFVELSRKVRTAWLTQQVGRLDLADQHLIAQAAGALSRLADLA
ncbi:MarR family winged helix-turn-helix transcriptional regulator [Nakamurella sp. PAMC28650]|uniref:MarR family winged helix-turn-helix transcriptional regulator n=1 Tax=Nakamurella sp. PAMC28650 TaxID=2762325 RepID=UPI00164CDF0F|nr:MarR family transcriptional regulator [Nakamurella sp. PAMC28650]QNK83369.1 MarR family transcriptional regulator [Nakamurella sp. PAMC28650]